MVTPPAALSVNSMLRAAVVVQGCSAPLWMTTAAPAMAIGPEPLVAPTDSPLIRMSSSPVTAKSPPPLKSTEPTLKTVVPVEVNVTSLASKSRFMPKRAMVSRVVAWPPLVKESDAPAEKFTSSPAAMLKSPWPRVITPEAEVIDRLSLPSHATVSPVKLMSSAVAEKPAAELKKKSPTPWRRMLFSAEAMKAPSAVIALMSAAVLVTSASTSRRTAPLMPTRRSFALLNVMKSVLSNVTFPPTTSMESN
mmetsp:Transcript_10552/g.43047  ORF Transcript_10552/g.43047 Transcript_10552/m.43047 type:complete len:250 (-) Transcript_10552:2000-2749(-)